MGFVKWVASNWSKFNKISDSSQSFETETAEKLRQSEERYRGVVESQKDLVIRIDAAGRFTFVNDAYCRKLQKSRDDLIGTSFDPYVHPDDLTIVTNFVATLGNPPYRGFLEHRSWFSGEWRLTLWEGYAIRDLEGHIIEFQGVGRDITDQRTTEMALRESEEKFRTAFENSPVSQTLVGLDGQLLKVNRACCEFSGYSSEELLKKRVSDLTHPEDIAASIEAIQAMKEGRMRVYQVEKRYIHRSGRILTAILSTSAVKNEKGQPLYFVSQIVDISDRIHQEALLKRNAEELARSNTELAQFAYVVAHDIREPLRMITNFIELLVERANSHLDSVSREYAHFAVDGARRAQDLIRDLLSFAQVDRHDQSETPVDLNQILAQVKWSLHPYIEENKAEIT